MGWFFKSEVQRGIEELESFANGFDEIQDKVYEFLDHTGAGETEAAAYIWANLSEFEKDIAFYLLANEFLDLHIAFHEIMEEDL